MSGFKNLSLAILLALGGQAASAFTGFGTLLFEVGRNLQQVSYKGDRVHASHAKDVDIELPSASGGFAECKQFFPTSGIPVSSPEEVSNARQLCFDGFAVLYSTHRKTPLYTVEVLSKESIAAARQEQRTNLFFEDGRLPKAERATLDDYRGSGFDRGHNAPAGDMSNDRSMAQSFSLSNMMPQSPENNRKQWAGLEKATRHYGARASGRIFVFTGSVVGQPLLDTKTGLPGSSCPFVQSARKALDDAGHELPSGDGQVMLAAASRTNYKPPHTYDVAHCSIGNGVAVPSHIFKLVYDPTTNRAWAHWIENTDWALVGKPLSYEELVKRTGIVFLPGLHPHS